MAFFFSKLEYDGMSKKKKEYDGMSKWALKEHQYWNRSGLYHKNYI